MYIWGYTSNNGEYLVLRQEAYVKSAHKESTVVLSAILPGLHLIVMFSPLEKKNYTKKDMGDRNGGHVQLSMSTMVGVALKREKKKM